MIFSKNKFFIQTITEKNPQIQGAKINNIQKIAFQNYFEINPEKVRETIHKDLPKLKKEISELL